MQKKEKATGIQFLFSVFVCALGLVSFFIALSFPLRGKILPLAVTILLAVLGGAEAWSYREGRKDMASLKKLLEDKVRLFTAISLIAYPILLNFLGFVVASVLLMIALMLIRSVKNKVVMIVLSLAIPITVYVLFTTVAGVKMPVGPWGF